VEVVADVANIQALPAWARTGRDVLPVELGAGAGEVEFGDECAGRVDGVK
jgi:hypothetical protein